MAIAFLFPWASGILCGRDSHEVFSGLTSGKSPPKTEINASFTAETEIKRMFRIAVKSHLGGFCCTYFSAFERK